MPAVANDLHTIHEHVLHTGGKLVRPFKRAVLLNGSWIEHDHIFRNTVWYDEEVAKLENWADDLRLSLERELFHKHLE